MPISSVCMCVCSRKPEEKRENCIGRCPESYTLVFILLREQYHKRTYRQQKKKNGWVNNASILNMIYKKKLMVFHNAIEKKLQHM